MSYELVQDITVSSATTSVSFTGLNFTSADDLLLVSDFNNTTASNTSYYLFANANSTATNYYRQILNVYSTSIYADRVNVPQMAFVTPNNKDFSIMKIKLTNSGYVVYQSSTERAYGTSAIEIDEFNGTSTFTASIITSLTLNATTTNAIGVGSRFRLYKLVAEKVADITVSTATTSVDITGLSIDKSSEYMLVADINNQSGVSLDYYLYANNNTTATNYWTQRLFATGTSVFGDRNNDSRYFAVTSSNKSINIGNLKLTNNGNFVFQNNTSRDYGGSGVLIQTVNGTSTFTTSSITQLTISAGSANAIGVGSRFQLYKLR